MTARHLVALVLVLALGAAGVAVVTAGADDARRLGDWQLRGMNFTTWQTDAFASPTSDCQLAAVRATGTDAVAIVVTEYMAAPDAIDIAPDASRTASPASVEHAIRRAQALGLDVWLKPHVDVVDDSWRGEIAPSDRAAWYRSYRAFIARHADVAARLDVDGFVVGTELKTMSGDEGEWRAIVGDVRARFRGPLTYSANWDEYQDVPWWDAVDLLGPEAYFPLGSGDSVGELVAAWRPHVQALDRFRRRWDKPVLFPEIGYASVEDGARTPHGRGGPVDDAVQQRAYEATLRVWSGVRWLRGMFWWQYQATGPGDPGDHTPQGKPAERTLAEWQTGDDDEVESAGACDA